MGLVVLGQAGVAGIVREWRFHGGGAGAEGAVHEALEHAGVEEGVVGIVMGAHLLEFFKRVLEGQPLADTDAELALFFHLLKDEEILPVAEVLNGGDAVCESVGDGELVAAAALVVAGGRDDFVDKLLRRFAKDAGGLAAGVEVDGSALRRGGFAGDAGCRQGGRVRDGDVAIDAVEEGGVAGGDLVEVLAGGENLLVPEGVVPVAAGEPVSRGSGLGEEVDFSEHFGERFYAGEIDVELGLASAAKVGVGVVEAGKDEGTGAVRVEIVETGVGAGEPGDLIRGADGQHLASADGDGLHALRLVLGEALAGVYDASEEDGVRDGC